jgi:hypothetical protein
MDTNHLTVLELQRLLSRVSEHGSQHLQDAESDLEQTLFLLSQAIKTLSNGFMQVSQLVNQQQKVIDRVLPAYAGDASQAGYEINLLRQRINAEINTVVTGLQFQDLTSQLITRSVKRISGLRDLLNGLASHPSGLGASQNASVEELLETMHDSLNVGSGALKDGLNQEVKQKHMVSGEIELF